MSRIPLSVCSAALLAVAASNCGSNVQLDDDCTTGETRCQDNRFEVCQEGSFVLSADCVSACDEALGCIACDPNISQACGPEGVYSCSPDGSLGDLLVACAADACIGGVCHDPCVVAATQRSYVGCEYWAIDSDNIIEPRGEPDENGDCYDQGAVVIDPVDVCMVDSGWGPEERGICDYDGQCWGYYGSPTTCETVGARCALDAAHAPFAIVVANPDDEEGVTVTVTATTGDSTSINLAPGGVGAIYPQQEGIPDQTIEHAGIEAKAYHVVSSRPIVAYQFNPLEQSDVFSNDGTILLPVAASGTEYLALSHPSYNWHPGFVSIVAAEEGITTITVTTTASTRSGPGVLAGGPGTTSYTLEQGEVLTIESEPGDGPSDNLTGSRIVADRNVSVFGGHQGGFVGDPGITFNICCADHMEAQLPPLTAWGKRYAVARSVKRHNGQNHDLLRIVAQIDDTQLTFSAQELECPILSAGEHCDVHIADDVFIEGSQPIMVGQLLTANSGDEGDPAMAFAVPVEQYLSEYTFLTPEEYEQNYVSISARAGDAVWVDGVDVSTNFVAIGNGELGAIRVPVAPGRHRLECSQKCGVMAYGWSDAVSYLFAAGLDLQVLID